MTSDFVRKRRLKFPSEAARLVVLQVVRGKPQVSFTEPNASIANAGSGQKVVQSVSHRNQLRADVGANEDEIRGSIGGVMREKSTARPTFDPNVVQEGSETRIIQAGILKDVRPNHDHGNHDYSTDERHIYDIAGLAVKLTGWPVSFCHEEQERLETSVHPDVHEGHLQYHVRDFDCNVTLC